jgi:hypothetical protein
MIIFDLDGTLADCEHRLHFVDPEKNLNYRMCLEDASGKHKRGKWYHDNGIEFIPDWKSFYEACDKDSGIESVISIMRRLSKYEEIQIWSGRCESVRDKTINWLYNKIPCFCPMSWFDKNLKMRPIGDNTPDDELKEKWLDELLSQGKTIDFVFDDRPKVIRMWRRRGIFVFDCNQNGKEF